MMETEALPDIAPDAATPSDALPGAAPPPTPPQGSEAGAALPVSAIMAIPIELEIVLATVKLAVADIMALRPGGTLPLGVGAGSTLTVLANGMPFAQGELCLADPQAGMLGVRITRLVAEGAAP